MISWMILLCLLTGLLQLCAGNAEISGFGSEYPVNEAQATLTTIASLLQTIDRNSHVTSQGDYVTPPQSETPDAQQKFDSAQDRTSIEEIQNADIDQAKDNSTGLVSPTHTSKEQGSVTVSEGISSQSNIPISSRTMASESFRDCRSVVGETCGMHNSRQFVEQSSLSTSASTAPTTPTTGHVTSHTLPTTDHMTTMTTPTDSPTMRPGLFILIVVIPPSIIGALFFLLCPIMCCVCKCRRGGVSQRSRRYKGYKYQRVEVI